ncbi:MAG: hypothetical protein JSV79_02915 [Armatimonadota bacterium]|nr:MAG: hypothetical protein JSV79_02915 [Armatimonadota bacterium]
MTDMETRANRTFTADLLTFLFLVAAAVYVVLTFVLRPREFPLSVWEFAYSHGAEGPGVPIAWFYYILWHPYFAILWIAGIGVAAVQFYRRRERGRVALQLASRLVLLVVPLAFVGLVLLSRGADSTGVLVWLGAAFAAGSVLCVLCILILCVLGSPKVKAAMIDRRWSGAPPPR